MKILERTTVGPSSEHLHKAKYPDHWERYEFASQFVKNKQVVDIACGPGYGTALLSKISGINAVGLDVDKETVNAAIQNYGKYATFKTIEGYDWALQKDSIDIVVSLETFEHLDNPEAFLKEAYRILKTGGKLILSTPINETEGRFNPVNQYHLREYTWDELGNHLGAYFTIESRFSQIAKSGEVARTVNNNPFLKFLKNIVPVSIRALLIGTLNEKLGYKKGTIQEGKIEGISVQIAICVKK